MDLKQVIMNNQLSKDIWNMKYRYEDETFDEFLNRISAGDEPLRQIISDGKFLFGGRILAHRGINRNVTYSNCYVMPKMEDNIESIFESAKRLARTYSYGGGCGIDITNLRPRGAIVNNSAKITTGAVSFMELFDLTTSLIGQNGRRGALMITIKDSHPDLEEFIDIKTKDGSITKANISIRITDDFMDAVENDLDWRLHYTVPATGEVISKSIPARTLYNKIMENNWN